MIADFGFTTRQIRAREAKAYIRENHYSKGCHNGPSPCFGLFYAESLIGCLMFATPCSENVRSSLFGVDHKDKVTELHRLHIVDGTPKNTESWFIGWCLRELGRVKPSIEGVISFADGTEGHSGTIYQATNFLYCGTTGKAWFYIDQDGRLRHPRQCGKNISKEEAAGMGWERVRRDAKHRYVMPLTKWARKHLLLSPMAYPKVPE